MSWCFKFANFWILRLGRSRRLFFQN